MMFYKKILSAGAILSAGTLLSNAASTLVDVDFTQATEMPESWTSGQWNGNNTPHFAFGTTGAVVNYPWKQNFLETNLDLSLSDDVSYTITFETYANNTDNYQVLFYLSSESGSLVLGNSYTSNSDVYAGTLDSAVGSGFFSFQDGTGRTVVDAQDTLTGLDVSNGLSYTLTLTAGSLSYTVSDGTTEKTGSITTTLDSFSKLGFSVDGSNTTVGIENISVTSSIPEPSAFGLIAGLGALALVVSRRRRRA